MATKIRLMRMGKIRTPFYRIVVTDSRKARNGLSIEEIGRYVPGQEPSIIETLPVLQTLTRFLSFSSPL